MDLNKIINRRNKLVHIYKKWVNVYNIFEKYSYDYKTIKKNINEINKYIKIQDMIYTMEIWYLLIINYL